jgi:hypothetical protein
MTGFLNIFPPLSRGFGGIQTPVLGESTHQCYPFKIYTGWGSTCMVGKWEIVMSHTNTSQRRMSAHASRTAKRPTKSEKFSPRILQFSLPPLSSFSRVEDIKWIPFSLFYRVSKNYTLPEIIRTRTRPKPIPDGHDGGFTFFTKKVHQLGFLSIAICVASPYILPSFPHNLLRLLHCCGIG